MKPTTTTGLEIAVIGIGLRFPGASTPDQFWNNLKDGVESLTEYSDLELRNHGYPDKVIEDPNFVKTGGGLISDIDCFDAAFFGYTPNEAKIMDPQMRLFHEIVWATIEDGGYDVRKYGDKIGLFAGRSPSTVWDAYNFLSGKTQEMNSWEAEHFTNSDFMASKIAYSLNLKGPSFVVDTACSTSLVAVHLACRSLLMGECDMAVAGGISIKYLENYGYFFTEGIAKSRDGHCRAFDKEASGFVPGNGGGAILLKTLRRAVTDRDNIYAVIKGSAINNDGKNKIGYTAPSIEGQVDVIRSALNLAKVDAATLSYIEAHGAGTPLGDPIEIKALARAFNSDKKQYCGLGSVKTNIGHLDRASGIAGLIKTVLSLKNKIIPASLNFREVNPLLNIENSPFYINKFSKTWPDSKLPNRAAVTSLGIGGTNAHVILEEAPELSQNCADQKPQLLILSAESQEVLRNKTVELCNHLRKNNLINLSDVAFTLQMGRAAMKFRWFLVSHSIEDVILGLDDTDSSSVGLSKKNKLCFIFSGQGAQYSNMGITIYNNVPYYKEQVDRCCAAFKIITQVDIKNLLYPAGSTNFVRVDSVLHSGPVKFIFEYCLAKLLIRANLLPDIMIGHSFGEYTVACLAGVFTFEEALKIVYMRGLLMSKTEDGLMLSVNIGEAAIKEKLVGSITVAAINTPENCIVSGTRSDIEIMQKTLVCEKIEFIELNFSKAAHSPMMLPIVSEFREILEEIDFKPPKFAYISGVTGKVAEADRVTTPEYWIEHLLNTNQFGLGISSLLADSYGLFVQIGCDKGLPNFVNKMSQNPECALNLIKGVNDDQVNDWFYFLKGLGKIWCRGFDLNWLEILGVANGSRISLPVYPFEKKRFPAISNIKDLKIIPFSKSEIDTESIIYNPVWLKKVNNSVKAYEEEVWIIFLDQLDFGHQLVKCCDESVKFIYVIPSQIFSSNEFGYTVNPRSSSDYNLMFQDLVKKNISVDKIVHLWCFDENPIIKYENIADQLYEGFYSLLFVAKSLTYSGWSEKIEIDVVTTNMQCIVGNDLTSPLKATVLGILKVIGVELPFVSYRSIDFSIHDWSKSADILVSNLYNELRCESERDMIGFRDNVRWEQFFVPSVDNYSEDIVSEYLKAGNTYVITGGLGGIGLVLAEAISANGPANFILVSRTDYSLDNKIEDAKLKTNLINKIQQGGSSIIIIKADISKLDSLDRINEVVSKFGKLDGIIHAAGIVDLGGSISSRGEVITRDVLLPKIEGTFNIMKLAEYYKVGFILLCSSTNAIIPVSGQSSHSSGNCYLDAIAQHYENSATKVISINWSSWSEIGQAKQFKINVLNGLSNQEGKEIFFKSLSSRASQLIATKENFSLKYRLLSEKSKQSIVKSNSLSKTQEEPAHSMPEYSGNEKLYARTQTESALTDIWKDIFGYEKIAIDADIFELGGSSLTLVSMSARIFKKFNIKIPIALFYKIHTIRKQATFLTINSDSEDLGAFFFRSTNENFIFCFPPAISYSFCYDGLASKIDKFSLCGFNFIEDENRISMYVREINKIQKEGPIVLMAYSFGGVLTFNVAKALEDVGRVVSDIILLDCIWHGDRNAEELNKGTDFFLNIEKSLRDYGLEFLLDDVKGKVEKYFEYTHSFKTLEKVDAMVHSLVSEENDYLGSVTGWKNYTNSKFYEYKGYGDHSSMLSGISLEKNAELLVQILDGLGAFA